MWTPEDTRHLIEVPKYPLVHMQIRAETNIRFAWIFASIQMPQ